MNFCNGIVATGVTGAVKRSDSDGALGGTDATSAGSSRRGRGRRGKKLFTGFLEGFLSKDDISSSSAGQQVFEFTGTQPVVTNDQVKVNNVDEVPVFPALAELFD